MTQNEHLQRAFAHFDRDGSGDITADEIMEALKGQGVSQSEADELLAEWDANRDGVIRRVILLHVPRTAPRLCTP